MIAGLKRYILHKYVGSSALNYRRASALVYLHALFILMGVGFVIFTWIVQGMNTNVLTVIVLTVLLVINLLLIRQGAYDEGVLFALILTFVALSATVYLAYNRTHVSLYNLGFFHVFSLLVGGLISTRRQDSIILGALSVAVLAHYFFFEIFPAETLPLSAYVHDYLAINMVIVLSTFISVYINRQINRLFHELESVNTHLEETVDQRTNALVESEKLAALGGMVGGISHEINTPLGNSVTVVSHLGNEFRDIKKQMEDGSLTKSRMDEFITLGNQAVAAAERNLGIARDLVTNFKKIAADLHYDDPLVQDIREELEIVLSSMKNSWKHLDQLEIVLDGPRRLETPMYPGLLWHIFTNLLNNSFVHGLPDGAGVIRIGYSIKRGRLRLEYSDDGVGMDEATLKQHLEPFFTTRRGQGGTGLGMNIVYNLLTKIGAKMNVQSKPGEGVAYAIEFPEISG